MMKLLWLLVLASLACRLITGRWPWQFVSLLSNKSQEQGRARRLLGVSQSATRQEIIEAHRRLIAEVHPDRGGSNESVHEANAARDLLLAEIDKRSPKQ